MLISHIIIIEDGSNINSIVTPVRLIKLTANGPINIHYAFVESLILHVRQGSPRTALESTLGNNIGLHNEDFLQKTNARAPKDFVREGPSLRPHHSTALCDLTTHTQIN